MSEGQTPDWSLLPHDPRAFFGLSGEFDGKDLKRSYNRLLRQFKPERFPAEFQRIRAAYEHLDNELRYGATMPTSDLGTIRYEWRTDAESSPPTPQRQEIVTQRAAPIPRNATLLERIQSEPLGDVFRQLVGKEDKSSYEFYVLGIMSDLVQRKDGLQFVRWLLAGLQCHPDDLGLVAILYEYFRGPVPDKALAGLLVATSKAIPNDRFFSITEPLWKQLLRTAPFGEFRKVLEACERNLRDLHIDNRLIFLIAVLKPAMWRADLDWIDRTMTLVEENFERVPRHLQFEIDILELLRGYAKTRSQFLNGHPLREQMDQALCDYFTADQSTGDQAVLACETQIAHDAGLLLTAFPLRAHEDYENIYLLWIATVNDVFERNLEPIEEQQNNSLWQSRVRALLERLENMTRTSRYVRTATMNMSAIRFGIGCLYFGAIVMMCFVGTMLTLHLKNPWVILGVVLFCVTAGLSLTAWFHFRRIRPWLQRRRAAQEFDFYEKIWRPEFAEFLDRSQLDFFELRGLFFECNIFGLTTANRAIALYQRDYALPMFSMAQRCLV